MNYYFENGTSTGLAYGQSHQYFTEDSGDEPCGWYADPRETILRDLNMLMFRAGVVAAELYDSAYLEARMDEALPVERAVTGYLQGDQNVSNSNLWWFLAAAFVEVTCIAMILPTYLGWWTLRRSVSFSPLEIAKVCSRAFELTVRPFANNRNPTQ